MENNISLRAVELDDASLLFEWENNQEIWEVSNTIAPFSKYQIEQYVLSAQNDIYTTGQLRLMIEANIDGKPEVVGMIDLFDFDAFNQRAGVGVMIHKKWQNKKIATKALEILSEYAFETLLLHQLYCNISYDNTNSIKLFKNSGFQLIGVQKDWQKTKDGFKDIWLFQKINPKYHSTLRKWEVDL